MESKRYKMVKNHFERGRWGIERVAMAMERGQITKEEFAEIVGMRFAPSAEGNIPEAPED